MENLLSNDWKTVLSPFFETEAWKNLCVNVEKSYLEQICYPPKQQIFNAFNYCAFKDVKVVIIGQDPYHGKGQANGLCFSYVGGSKLPPSLKNIFKEVATDLNTNMPTQDGDLTKWAKQGVLLLNNVLTVEEGKPNSHKKLGWEEFTSTVIKTVSDQKEGVVFMLWGGFAHKKEKIINIENHYVLKATHPSPLGANKGGWFGCENFSKTNIYLKKIGVKSINWKLEVKNQPPTLFTL